MKAKRARSEKALKKPSPSASPAPAPAVQPKLPRPRRSAAKPKAARKKPAPKPESSKVPVAARPKALKAAKKTAARLAKTVSTAPASVPKPLKRKQPVRKLLRAKALPRSKPPRSITRPAPTAPAPMPAAPASSPAQPEKKPAPPRPALKVPPILLEGDEPSAPPVTGPGHKYALGPTPPMSPLTPPEGQLPEAYGTGRLFLTARDPHCLYAHWDIAAEEQRRYNALSLHQHLTLRLYLETITGQPLNELPVHPESTHWFIHVDRAGVRYVAELGYYQPDHQWRTIATAEPVMAPPKTVAEEQTVQFATFPPEVPLAPAAKPAKEVFPQPAPASPPPAPVKVARPVPTPQAAPPPAPQGQRAFEPMPVRPPQVSARPPMRAPVAEAPLPLPGVRPEANGQLVGQPTPTAGPPPAPWTPAQEQALAEVVSTTLVRQEWLGSAEITELIRRQAVQVRPAQEAISSIAAAQLGLPAPAPVTGISSPMGELAEAAQAISSPLGVEARAPGRGFWFNVNAELIIYGATEPDATVSIGGRPIRLRPDGTFSYRFALPDGQYALPIAATSSDGEVRRAELDFHRGTHYHGDVGAHPQDPALRPPTIQNVS